eukprot:jgi/Mesvir1/29488/Mv14029-RA.1
MAESHRNVGLVTSSMVAIQDPLSSSMKENQGPAGLTKGSNSGKQDMSSLKPAQVTFSRDNGADVPFKPKESRTAKWRWVHDGVMCGFIAVPNDEVKISLKQNSREPLRSIGTSAQINGGAITRASEARRGAMSTAGCDVRSQATCRSATQDGIGADRAPCGVPVSVGEAACGTSCQGSGVTITRGREGRGPYHIKVQGRRITRERGWHLSNSGDVGLPSLPEAAPMQSSVHDENATRSTQQLPGMRQDSSGERPSFMPLRLAPRAETRLAGTMAMAANSGFTEPVPVVHSLYVGGGVSGISPGPFFNPAGVHGRDSTPLVSKDILAATMPSLLLGFEDGQHLLCTSNPGSPWLSSSAAAANADFEGAASVADSGGNHTVAVPDLRSSLSRLTLGVDGGDAAM